MRRDFVVIKSDGTEELDRDKLFLRACMCVYVFLFSAMNVIGSLAPLINSCPGLQGTFQPSHSAPF